MNNHKNAALRAMTGKEVEHVPFIARMDLWYNYHKNSGTLPQQYKNATLWDIQRDLGIGIFGFGAWDISFYKLVGTALNIEVQHSGDSTTTICKTPYGDLTSIDRVSDLLREAAGTGARTRYPFQSSKDYDALAYVLENTFAVENYNDYSEYIDLIGNDGLALPFASHLPAHQLMITYMGYEQFYYEMYENENRLNQLLDILTERYYRIISMAAASPAQAVEVGGNYDESMTPPPIFEKYFMPIYKESGNTLKKHNKIMVVHGDGEMKKLLEYIRDSGIQVVEALTPKPMTSIDIRHVKDIWKDKVAIWGGIASIMLTDVFSDNEFHEYMNDLFSAIAPGQNFILGFGDNVPTDASWGRIMAVIDYWRKYGSRDYLETLLEKESA